MYFRRRVVKLYFRRVMKLYIRRKTVKLYFRRLAAK